MDDLDLGATIKGFSPSQKVFNRYTLRKILGRGGMGVVWLARDEELQRDVAIKFLPEVVMTDRVALDDLKRETRRALELTHPHIVRIYDFVVDARTAGIAMEYVAGDTISHRRLDQPNRVFEVADVQKWALQFCEAMAYAHEKARIVHRDLKPANLMLDAQGDLKIADFGISRSISDSVSRVSNQAGTSGTPFYMSPQQMMGEEPAVTDDVYSFGATLYELLTGKPPFYTGNVLLQVQSKTPSSLAERRQALDVSGQPIPATWEDTIAACLAKEAKDRPQSMREIAARLQGTEAATRSAKNSGQAGAATPSPRTEKVERDLRARSEPARRSGSTIWIIAAAVIVLASAGYYFGVHAPEQKRLAEIKRLEDEGRAAEAERLRNEKEKAAAAAKAQADKEQGEYAIVVAKIDAVLDGAPAAQRESTDKAVKDYLAVAPARFKADVEGRWTKRSAAWETHRLSTARGGLRVRTIPEGAEVQIGSLTLEKSPVTLRDVRLGKYPVVIRADGYEEWRGELEVKENEFTDPTPVKLVRSTGRLVITSVPSGINVQVDGKSLKTPADIADVPVGAHEVVFAREQWPALKKEVAVSRNQQTDLAVNLTGGSMEITSSPAKAEVWIDNALRGVTPITLQDMPPGITLVELRLKGYAKAQKTVEPIPGRAAEKWSAILRRSDFLAGRPDFIHGPTTMRTKLTSTTTGANMNFKMSRTSDIVVSGPGTDGVWNNITETVVSESSSIGSQYEHVEGTTFKYQRSPSGKWTGQLVSGNWRGGAYKAEYDKYLSPFGTPVWVMPVEYWPTAETEVGGTWNVPLNGRLSFLGGVENMTGTLSAQLKKATDESVQIEFTFDVTGTNTYVNDQYRYSGTWLVEVNLEGKYVARTVLRYKQDGKYPSQSTLETEVISAGTQ